MITQVRAVPKPDVSAVLALAFGTTVAMWAVGFVGRLPAVMASPRVLLFLLVACLLIGGFLAGRYTLGGWRAGVPIGLVTAMLNLLILGSLLPRDDGGQQLALWGIPGFLIAVAAVMALAAAPGAWLAPTARRVNWPSVFAHVAVAATLLLLIVGGLVTSKEAGLAVTDWPNTFGYSMFLYPLSRMTGGVYYEHSHRLFGSLVGLTTLVLAILLQFKETRPWVRRFALAALALVIVQGILGGLRVTGRFTLSTAPQDMAPSLPLAALHGVLGQLVFGALVGLAVVTREPWREARGARQVPSASGDRTLAVMVVAVLVLQLTLGALVRHFSWGLVPHLTLAAFVVVAVIGAGIRVLALGHFHPVLRRLGKALMHLVGLQVLLGVGALTALAMRPQGAPPSGAEVILATAHQATGALLLATALMLALWTFRLRRPGPAES